MISKTPAYQLKNEVISEYYIKKDDTSILKGEADGGKEI